MTMNRYDFDYSYINSYIDKTKDLKNINRLELIDEKGRSYVKYNIKSINFSIQDNNQTLKIFINKGEFNEK